MIQHLLLNIIKIQEGKMMTLWAADLHL
jgi:hypothetical protein